MGIQTLFFDAAGTLFYLPKGVGWHYRDVASRFGCTLEAESLSHAFRTVWKRMPPRPATQEPRTSDDKSWWFHLVMEVLKECGGAKEALPREEYFEALYTEFTKPGIWELFPEVREVLAALSPRYRLGIISNFDGRLRPILANLGISQLLDPIVISSEVGADKPDSWIFQQALVQARCAAAQSIHVGDDPLADWQGARDAGLRVFQLERPTNSLWDLARELGVKPARSDG
ncbi:MAG TPA: HAD-IA family hydrolase [Chthoniobacter sp.]|nr:HAD-IA family hydrolase [Chthoniobacter sp.]